MKTLEEIRLLASRGNVIPLHKEFLPDLETPITALLKLKGSDTAGKSGNPCRRVFLLESVEVGEKLARFSFLGRDPLYTFAAKGRDIEIGGKENRVYQADALEELRKFLDRYRGVDDPDLPAFSGGAVGLVCYDAVRLVEDIPASGQDDFNLPDLHFGFYNSFLVFDHIKHKLRIVANVMPDEHGSLEEAYQAAAASIADLEACLAKPLTGPPRPRSTPPRAPPAPGRPSGRAISRRKATRPACSSARNTSRPATPSR